MLVLAIGAEVHCGGVEIVNFCTVSVALDTCEHLDSG